MRKIKNSFGEGILYEQQDIEGKIYVVCSACMSIYSEFLTWANAHKDRFTLDPAEADSIIVLSCQVTDLAILNDLRYLERMFYYGDKHYYIGGCLARRFDIELDYPEFQIRRLDNVRLDGKIIYNKNLIDFAKPFWVKDFKENEEELKNGHLFRDMYPLRIGVGCKGKCNYCTIRETRGQAYEIEPNIDEFLSFDNILLIADSPSTEQIIKWINISMEYQKPISIRNLEPTQAVKCWDHILTLVKFNLLKILHVPIQSSYYKTLNDMGRNTNSTLIFLELAEFISRRVILATNIIIDYKDYPNPDMEYLNRVFNYVSWNPYWDGKWDRKVAEIRHKSYIG